MAEETTTPEEQIKYELMLILQADLGEDGTKNELEEVRNLIAENGGEIFHEDLWGIRDLAYRIKKQERGYYAVFNTTLDPEKIKEMEQALNIHQTVLRYMLMRTPNNYEIKTFKEYEAEAEKEKKEKEKEEAEKKEKKAKKRAPAKPRKKTTPVKAEEKPKKKEEKEEKTTPEVKEKSGEVEKVQEAEKSEKVEKPEEADKKEDKKDKLEEVDEKLKSIINDPDISL